MVLENQLQVKAAENTELNIYAMQEFSRGEFGPAQDARRDFLLDLVSKNGDTLAVTVYGATHSWNDNIERWNQTHQNKRFSLITIEPCGLEDYYGLYPEMRPVQ